MGKGCGVLFFSVFALMGGFFMFMIGQSIQSAQAQRIGITSDPLHIFDDASMPAKEFRVLRTTYAPGGQNPKHYHPHSNSAQ